MGMFYARDPYKGGLAIVVSDYWSLATLTSLSLPCVSHVTDVGHKGLPSASLVMAVMDSVSNIPPRMVPSLTKPD